LNKRQKSYFPMNRKENPVNVRRLGVGLAMVLAALLPVRGLAEAYVVVKIQDMCRNTTTEMMSETEFKALEKTIQIENRYFQQALQLAAKQWREDEMNKGTPFAGSRLMPRKIVGSAERFSSQEKAQQKLTAIEDMESRKQFRAREKEIANRGGKKKTKEELAREFDRGNALSSAAEVVKAKLDELISAKANAAAGGAPPPATPPAKAPDAAAKEAGQKAL